MAYIILTAIDYFAKVLYFLIFIRVIISWLPLSRDGQIMQFLYAVTEPILGPIRSLIAKSPLGGPGMMLDFSPIIAVFLIEIFRTLLNTIMRGL